MKKSYIIGELEVLSYNIDPQKDWVDAKKSCEDLGEGWTPHYKGAWSSF